MGNINSRYVGNKKRRRNINNDAITAAVILTPMIAWWVIFCGFPVLFGFALGFMKWNNLGASPIFNGFKNFGYFFRDREYIGALWRAVWLGGLSTGLTMVAGFVVGNIMNVQIRGKGIYRTVWYVPAVVSTAAVTQVLSMLLDPTTGAFNRILGSLGLKAINVETYSSHGILVIVLYSLWRGVGANALLWLAGLQSIDKALYEAADLDGANAAQKFRYITVPSLSTIATYAAVTGAIGAIQIYEQVAFITGGGPAPGQTQTLVFMIMRDAFYNGNLGMAGTSSVIMSVTVLVFVLFFFKRLFNIEPSDRQLKKKLQRGMR